MGWFLDHGPAAVPGGRLSHRANRTDRSAWSAARRPGRRIATTTCVSTVATGRWSPLRFECLSECLLQQKADLALRAGHAHVQRQWVGFSGCTFRTHQSGADLRSVAMCDHHAPAVGHHVGDRAAGLPDMRALGADIRRLVRSDEGVPANRDNHGRLHDRVRISHLVHRCSGAAMALRLGSAERVVSLQRGPFDAWDGHTCPTTSRLGQRTRGRHTWKGRRGGGRPSPRAPDVPRSGHPPDPTGRSLPSAIITGTCAPGLVATPSPSIRVPPALEAVHDARLALPLEQRA